MAQVVAKNLGNGVTQRTKKEVQYRCNKCRVLYDSESEALKCYKRPTEKAACKVGDKVTWVEHAICSDGGGRDRYFPINAVIIRVGILHPVDEDYANRHMGGRLRNTHARAYLVEFSCVCGKKQKRSMNLYSVEMRLRTKRLQAKRKK